MKLHIDLTAEGEEEIIIRCHTIDARVLRAQKILSTLLETPGEMRLLRGETEYFIPMTDILFFETEGAHIAAHTADAMYTADITLSTLEKTLPYSFVRISKSSIANAALVSSIARNPIGSSEIGFRSAKKNTYVSRMYYKTLKERIQEIRL